MQFTTLIMILTYAGVVFMLTGGIAFTYFLAGVRFELLNPEELSLTPVAIFCLLLGLMGSGLLILAPGTWKRDLPKLAWRQMLVGFGLLFTSGLGYELLWKLAGAPRF